MFRKNSNARVTHLCHSFCANGPSEKMRGWCLTLSSDVLHPSLMAFVYIQAEKMTRLKEKKNEQERNKIGQASTSDLI